MAVCSTQTGRHKRRARWLNLVLVCGMEKLKDDGHRPERYCVAGCTMLPRYAGQRLVTTACIKQHSNWMRQHIDYVSDTYLWSSVSPFLPPYNIRSSCRPEVTTLFCVATGRQHVCKCVWFPNNFVHHRRSN